MNDDAPLVAVVGRPNVGKSALFNRLTRSSKALVEEIPGTTRDRIYGSFEWNGRAVRVVDTGGLVDSDEDPFGPLVRQGVEEALSQADAILFVVDASEGATAADHHIAKLLRRSPQPMLLVGNKIDRTDALASISELYELGSGDPIPISAYHGIGVGDLMDSILEIVPVSVPEPEAERLKIAIVGRPNVGKSLLVNTILGEERSIVSDIPGTTRDAIDTPFTFAGRDLLLVDTAGIRRRGKIERGVERHSVQRAENAIDRADVVFMLIDQAEPVASQDTHIAGYIADQGKGLVLVVNKWDLSEARDERHEFAKRVDHRYRFAPWAPIQFTSALTGEGVTDVLEMAIHIEQVRNRRAQTSELNRVIHRAMADHGPPTVRHRKLKVMYATQAECSPPTFVFFVNDPATLHFSYERYLENALREAFDLEGTAIRLVFRKRSQDRHEATA